MVKQTHLVALTLALVWLCSGAIGIAVAQESAKSSDSKNKTYFLNSDCQNAQSSQEKPKVGRSGAAKAGFAMMLGPGVKLGPGFKPKAGVQVMDSSGNLIYPRQNTTISSERPSIKDSIEPKKAEPIELKNAASAAGQNEFF